MDVFFVLSGFLVTAPLCQERDRTGRIDLRTFYERRARPPRIGPCRDDVHPLPTTLNAQRVLGRGQFTVPLGGCAAGVAVVLAHLVTGAGPGILDWVRWSLCTILALDVLDVLDVLDALDALDALDVVDALDVLVAARQALFVLGAWRAPVLRPAPRCRT
ncbi:hypothetical protein [Streptomyces sp. NPDC101776]|uniref:hypothetical protein n=1 Tax=Streptomyces sp. NPDC101776 TaxID=3366146 RepID=UPI0037F51148